MHTKRVCWLFCSSDLFTNKQSVSRLFGARPHKQTIKTHCKGMCGKQPFEGQLSIAYSASIGGSQPAYQVYWQSIVSSLPRTIWSRQHLITLPSDQAKSPDLFVSLSEAARCAWKSCTFYWLKSWKSYWNLDYTADITSLHSRHHSTNY